jgi:hypothetical protein
VEFTSKSSSSYHSLAHQLHEICKEIIIMPTNRKGIFSRLWNMLRMTSDYIFGAAARIFSPSTDNYPKTGTQPYKGDPNSKK